MKTCPIRNLKPRQIRVRVGACGVCRTDLHVVDGELPDPNVPIIPGHEIVGRIDAIGPDVSGLQLGERVGIPWLGHTCGHCPFCLSGRENLCDTPVFTGYTRNGGFATHAIADAHYTFPLGEHGRIQALAPLLCAGLSAGVPLSWRATANGSASMVSVRRRILSPRCTKARTPDFRFHQPRRPCRTGFRPRTRRRLGRWI